MKSVKVVDFLIVFFVIAASSLLIYNFFKMKTVKEYVVIKGIEGEFIYPLNEDKIIEVNGLIGKSKIEIINGCCHFIESPCKTNQCVELRDVNRLGFIACIPNKVYVRLVSGAKIKWEGADSVVY